MQLSFSVHKTEYVRVPITITTRKGSLLTPLRWQSADINNGRLSLKDKCWSKQRIPKGPWVQWDDSPLPWLCTGTGSLNLQQWRQDPGKHPAKQGPQPCYVTELNPAAIMWAFNRFIKSQREQTVVSILIFVIELKLGHSHIVIRTLTPLANKCALLQALALVTLNRRTLWQLRVFTRKEHSL